MSVDTVTAATPGQTEPDQTLPGEGADAAGREEFPGFGGIALPAGFELIAQDEALGPDVLQGLADVEARLGEALRYTDALADTAARHLLEAGGKRVRPLLTLLAARAAGAAEITGDVLDAAVVTELTHLATLYHDDVMDEAATRRGTDAAHRIWGNSVAILTGDLALGAAMRAVASAPVPRERMLQLLDLFDHTLAVSAAGELADVRLSLGCEEPTLQEALSVAEQKTAVYSFSLPMQCGAVLADSPDQLVDGLGRIGRHLGLAYQLVDDLTAVFGTPAQTGRPGIAGDLREGKRTPLVVHARTTSAWPVLERHLGDPDLDEQGVEHVRAALTTAGSRSFVDDLATQQLREATTLAEDLSLPPELVTWVGEVAGSLEGGVA